MLLAEGDWTPLKMFGVCVTICGAVWYSYRKEQTRKQEATAKAAERSKQTNDDEENITLITQNDSKFR